MTALEGDFTQLTDELSEGLNSLHQSTPELLRAFNDAGHAAMKSGVLGREAKELVALAIAVSTRCDPCIGFHAQALARLGATPQEVGEMLGMAVHMRGGPSLMYAIHARSAFAEFMRIREGGQRVPRSGVTSSSAFNCTMAPFAPEDREGAPRPQRR